MHIHFFEERKKGVHVQDIKNASILSVANLGVYFCRIKNNHSYEFLRPFIWDKPAEIKCYEVQALKKSKIKTWKCFLWRTKV